MYKEELRMKEKIWIILELVIELILVGGFFYYMFNKEFGGAVAVILIFVYEVLTDILKEVRKHNKYHNKIEEKIRRI